MNKTEKKYTSSVNDGNDKRKCTGIMKHFLSLVLTTKTFSFVSVGVCSLNEKEIKIVKYGKKNKTN
jgi:hypothetical protein